MDALAISALVVFEGVDPGVPMRSQPWTSVGAVKARKSV